MSEERIVKENIRLEGAQLIFRNFQGKPGPYNDDGDRNFGVIIPTEELAQKLLDDGWNIRRLRPREDDPEQIMVPWLKVKVKYGKYPPIANLINSRGKKRLDEETIEQLDWCRIRNCDLVIRPYNYQARPGHPAGISAYMKAIWVTIEEDEFDMKYADLRDLDEEEV